jgi:hypothetical protein
MAVFPEKRMVRRRSARPGYAPSGWRAARTRSSARGCAAEQPKRQPRISGGLVPPRDSATIISQCTFCGSGSARPRSPSAGRRRYRGGCRPAGNAPLRHRALSWTHPRECVARPDLPRHTPPVLQALAIGMNVHRAWSAPTSSGQSPAPCRNAREQPLNRAGSHDDQVTIASHFLSNTGTKKGGAMGIRTPDLLHAMQGKKLRHRRSESDTGRSARQHVSDRVRPGRRVAACVVSLLVTDHRGTATAQDVSWAGCTGGRGPPPYNPAESDA